MTVNNAVVRYRRGMRRSRASLVVSAVVLAALLSVATNAASDVLPPWYRYHRWVVVGVSAGLVAVACVVELWLRIGPTPGRDRPLPPREAIDAIIAELESMQYRLPPTAPDVRTATAAVSVADPIGALERLVAQWRRIVDEYPEPLPVIDVDTIISALRQKATEQYPERLGAVESALGELAVEADRIGRYTLVSLADDVEGIVARLTPGAGTGNRRKDVTADLARQLGPIIAGEIQDRAAQDMSELMREAAHTVDKGLLSFRAALRQELRTAGAAVTSAAAVDAAVRERLVRVGDRLIDRIMRFAGDIPEPAIELTLGRDDTEFWVRAAKLVGAVVVAKSLVFMLPTLVLLSRWGKVRQARRQLAGELRTQLRSLELAAEVGAVLESQARESFQALLDELRVRLNAALTELNAAEFLDELRFGLPTVEKALNDIAGRLDALRAGAGG